MQYMAAEIEYEQQNQITLNGQEKIVLRSYEIDTPVKSSTGGCTAFDVDC
jgi:hypothetical protein